MRRAERDTCVREGNACSIMIGKPALQVALRKPKSRVDDNIKIDVN
jgi:hypothetical protein